MLAKNNDMQEHPYGPFKNAANHQIRKEGGRPESSPIL